MVAKAQQVLFFKVGVQSALSCSGTRQDINSGFEAVFYSKLFFCPRLDELRDEVPTREQVPPSF